MIQSLENQIENKFEGDGKDGERPESKYVCSNSESWHLTSRLSIFLLFQKNNNRKRNDSRRKRGGEKPTVWTKKEIFPDLATFIDREGRSLISEIIA